MFAKSVWTVTGALGLPCLVKCIAKADVGRGNVAEAGTGWAILCYNIIKLLQLFFIRLECFSFVSFSYRDYVCTKLI